VRARFAAPRIASFVPLALLLSGGCSNTPSGSIELVTGGETDVFTKSPVPSTLRVDAVTQSSVTTLATVSLPATTVDLGTQDENNTAILQVTGLGASNTRLIYGVSIPVQYGDLETATLPIFVQRTGELARLPDPPSEVRPAPVVSTVQGQYLFIAGGTDSSLATKTQLYDFGALVPLGSPPTLPRAPLSMAVVGTVALLIDSQGATYFDLASDANADVSPPSGASFADVAGGMTVVADDGTEYVVGATRTTGAPTDKVLILNPSDSSVSADVTGKLTWASLTAPRLGASATWVSGRGLVVAGGSATAHGVELIGPLPSTTPTPFAYPPDASNGAGAAPLGDAQHVLLAGGIGPTGQDAGVRTVDLACSMGCMPAKWSSLPIAIGNAQAFAWDATDGFVVGSEPGAAGANSGVTHTFRLTSTAATEVATKVPHKNALGALSPVGTVLVVGGASQIESFVP
jgi:hypothetical protein